MAACHKCGKGKIKKRKDGYKKCRRCGYLPNGQNLSRDGKKGGERNILTLDEKLYLIQINNVRVEVHVPTPEGGYAFIDLISVIQELADNRGKLIH